MRSPDDEAEAAEKAQQFLAVILGDLPPGPWHEEPDRKVWVDTATGYDCLIKRNERLGILCGYVAVPPGHPAHGAAYDEVDVHVHGGLTYAARAGDVTGGICHVPRDGGPDNVWWLGFDCGHAWDRVPRYVGTHLDFAETLDGLTGAPSVTYKDWTFVEAEVTFLAAQLRELADK